MHFYKKNSCTFTTTKCVLCYKKCVYIFNILLINISLLQYQNAFLRACVSYIISQYSTGDGILPIGDFNARTGCMNDTYENDIVAAREIFI